MSDKWQPIETAPKDGTWVLLCGTIEVDYVDGCDVAYGDYGMGSPSPRMAISRFRNNSWRDQWDDYYGPEYAAYWMPLPEVP